MLSFCLEEIYEKNQSGTERFFLFYPKLRRRNCQKGKEMETIISACISAAVTLIVCVISNNAQQEKTRTLMEYKLKTQSQKATTTIKTLVLVTKPLVSNL